MYSTATTMEIVYQRPALTKGVEQSDKSWHFESHAKIIQVTELLSIWILLLQAVIRDSNHTGNDIYYVGTL